MLASLTLRLQKLPNSKEDVKVIRILLMLKFVLRCSSHPEEKINNNHIFIYIYIVADGREE